MLGTGALPGQQMAQTQRNRTHQSCMLGLVGSSVQADRGEVEGPGARRDKTDSKGLLCMGDSRGNCSSGARASQGWLVWLAAHRSAAWRRRSSGRASVFTENTVYFDGLEMPLSVDLFFHCEKAY